MEFWLGTLVLMGFPMKGRAGWSCSTRAVAAGIATTSDGLQDLRRLFAVGAVTDNCAD